MAHLGLLLHNAPKIEILNLLMIKNNQIDLILVDAKIMIVADISDMIILP